jgi:hypothetical protein
MRFSTPLLVRSQFYPKNPSFGVEKFTRFGKMEGSALSGMPNYEHRVAPFAIALWVSELGRLKVPT